MYTEKYMGTETRRILTYTGNVTKWYHRLLIQCIIRWYKWKYGIVPFYTSSYNKVYYIIFDLPEIVVDTIPIAESIKYDELAHWTHYQRHHRKRKHAVVNGIFHWDILDSGPICIQSTQWEPQPHETIYDDKSIKARMQILKEYEKQYQEDTA